MSKTASDLECKIILVGSMSVGKSSMTHSFANNSFSDTIESTIGAAFLHRQVLWTEPAPSGIPSESTKTLVDLLLWDTAGQERLRSLISMYYRAARAAILVYDITNEETLQDLPSWLHDIRRHCPPDLVLAVAANKIDLLTPEEQRIIPLSINQANSMLQENGFTNAKVFATSAKTGEGIQEVFMFLVKEVLSQPSSIKTTNDSQSAIDVGKKKTENQNDGNNGGGCC